LKPSESGNGKKALKKMVNGLLTPTPRNKTANIVSKAIKSIMAPADVPGPTAKETKTTKKTKSKLSVKVKTNSKAQTKILKKSQQKSSTKICNKPTKLPISPTN
jgi:hypothetical protein